jgi:hypothetical protein
MEVEGIPMPDTDPDAPPTDVLTLTGLYKMDFTNCARPTGFRHEHTGKVALMAIGYQMSGTIKLVNSWAITDWLDEYQAEPYFQVCDYLHM